MLIEIIRTIILFAVVIVVVRLMGKRQVGQLQPYEFVVVILLSALAAVPMANTGVPLISGLVPILTLLVTHVLVSYVALKSVRARGLICGKPSVLIENGKIIEEELIKQRYNINDLIEELRSKNAPNISDVEYAILETSGNLSVIPKSQKRPVMAADLNISTTYEGIPTALIIDGHVFRKNLNKINLTEQWLKEELKKFNVNNLKDVLFASIDSEGKLFYQVKLKAANR